LGGATIALYKGVPDVAMDGDAQLSPAAIVVNGADTGVGGTSLSSPLALGAWARLQSTHSNKLGFAPLALYPLAPGLLKAATGFRDIVVGTNGEFVATPGWDYTTGLGTFDISALDAALSTPKTALVGAVNGAAAVADKGRYGGAFGFGLLGVLFAGSMLRRRVV
jgi:subtilase family serine protease